MHRFLVKSSAFWMHQYCLGLSNWYGTPAIMNQQCTEGAATGGLYEAVGWGRAPHRSQKHRWKVVEAEYRAVETCFPHKHLGVAGLASCGLDAYRLRATLISGRMLRLCVERGFAPFNHACSEQPTSALAHRLRFVVCLSCGDPCVSKPLAGDHQLFRFTDNRTIQVKAGGLCLEAAGAALPQVTDRQICTSPPSGPPGPRPTPPAAELKS